MADRELKVRIATEGESKVKQAIDGTTRSAKNAAREQSQATKESAREGVAAAKKAAQDRTRAEKLAAKETAAAAKKAERERVQAAKQAAKEIAAEEAKLAKARAEWFRRQEQARKAAERRKKRDEDQRRRDEIRRSTQRDDRIMGGLAGAGAMAAGMMGLSGLQEVLGGIVSRMQEVASAVGAAAGRQGLGERTASAQQFELGLTRLADEVYADLAPAERRREVAELREELLRVAEATRQSPGDLLESLTGLQSEFSAFAWGRQNLRAIADEATRTGSEMQSLSRFVALTRQQFGDIDAGRAFDIVTQAGLQGAVTPEALASEFAPILGTFGSVVDRNQSMSAEARLRQFTAMANVVRSGGVEPAVAATQMRSLLAALDEREVQEDIALATGGRIRGRRRDRRTGQTHRIIQGGVQLSQFTDSNGAIDLAGFFEALSERQDFAGIGTIQGTVGRIEAAQALNTILQRQRDETTRGDENATFRELTDADAEAGRAVRDRGLTNVRGTDFMVARADAVRGQVEGIRNVSRSREANVANVAETGLQSQGLLGEILAATPIPSLIGTYMEHGGPVSDFLMRAAGQHELVAARQIRAAGPEMARQQEAREAAGIERRDLEEVMHGRPLRVEVVNPQPVAAAGVVAPDPRRSQPPVLRTGR